VVGYEAQLRRGRKKMFGNRAITAFLCLTFLASCGHDYDVSPNSKVAVATDSTKGIIRDPSSLALFGCIGSWDMSLELVDVHPDSRSLEEHKMTLRFLVNADKISRYSVNLENLRSNLSVRFTGVRDDMKVLSIFPSSPRILKNGSKEYTFTFRVASSPESLSQLRSEAYNFAYEIRLGGSLATYNDLDYPNDCREVVFREGDNLRVTYG